MKKNNLNALQEIVDQWNAKHPVGTAVQIINGVGGVTKTTTTAPAMLLTKSTPVTWLKGIHNYVLRAKLTVI